MIVIANEVKNNNKIFYIKLQKNIDRNILSVIYCKYRRRRRQIKRVF